MILEITELLESLVEEVALDEDNTDAIIHQYARRLLDIVDDETDTVFYPEDLPYID